MEEWKKDETIFNRAKHPRFNEMVEDLTKKILNDDRRNCPFEVSYDGITECYGVGFDTDYQFRKVYHDGFTSTLTNEVIDIDHQTIRDKVKSQLACELIKIEYYLKNK